MGSVGLLSFREAGMTLLSVLRSRPRSSAKGWCASKEEKDLDYPVVVSSAAVTAGGKGRVSDQRLWVRPEQCLLYPRVKEHF